MKKIIFFFFCSILYAEGQYKYLNFVNENKFDSIFLSNTKILKQNKVRIDTYKNNILIDSININGIYKRNRNGYTYPFSFNGFIPIPVSGKSLSKSYFSFIYSFYLGHYYSELQLIFKKDITSKHWILTFIRESENVGILEKNIDDIEEVQTDPNSKILSWRKPNKAIDFFSSEKVNLDSTQSISFLPVLVYNKKIKEEYQRKNYFFFKNTFTESEIDYLLCLYQRTPDSIEFFNNLGYYLEELNLNKEAIYLLNIVIGFDKFRTVAYLNLGDAYWAVKYFVKAKEMYKIYQTQMQNNRSEDRIPDRVLKRL